MEVFNKTKAVKLRGAHDKFLVADHDRGTVRQSRNGSSRRARWFVETVDGDPRAIRLKSCHGGYLAASDAAFLLGMTGNRVIQARAGEIHDGLTQWEPVRDGFQVKLRSLGGTFLRANGGTPPWRNSVTHDRPHVGSTQRWVLWDVESVVVPEDEALTDYLSMISNASSVPDEAWGSEIGSPVSVHSFSSPRFSIHSSDSPSFVKKTGMDLFNNAKAVRLRSHHEKYLTAADDEESVTQDRNASSKAARWTVEFVDGSDNLIRLKSCYNKYLTASNQPFLLGMTGRKVIQTSPSGRLDSSLEWEPIREGNQVKLRTRYGYFLRANGGLPPWRNSVTHDIPHRTATQDWVLWDVHVVEIIVRSPHPKAPAGQPDQVRHSDSSDLSSPSDHSSQSHSFCRQESSDSLVNSPPKLADGRMIYYRIADVYGNVDEGAEELCITFKGNGVDELTKKLEEETGLEGIVVCTRSPLNNKLYPLRLQLPPNNATMHVVILESSSRVARDFGKTGIQR